jgi:hypothetical protein
MKVEDQLSLIIAKLDEQSKGINDINRKITDVQGSIEELKAAKADFERWRPQVETKVSDLSKCVDSLRQQIDELKTSSAAPTSRPSSPKHGSVYITSPAPADLGATSAQAAMGPCGHGLDPSHQRFGSGGGVALPSNHLRSKVSPPAPPIQPVLTLLIIVLPVMVMLTIITLVHNLISPNLMDLTLNSGSNAATHTLISMMFLRLIG